MGAKYKNLVFILLISTISITSCSNNVYNIDEIQSTIENKQDEVVIPVIFATNTSYVNEMNKELVDKFNEEFSGRYRIEVEWLYGSPADYRNKIKMLNSSSSLPAIVTDVGVEPLFYQLLKDNNRIINIKPYIDEDDVWKSRLITTTIDKFTEDNGEIYLIPLDNITLSGIYWNRESFAKAGITSFPSTWNGFWETCEKLKAFGITPLSLHTTGTSWSSMLIASSYLGTSKDGIDFIEKKLPNDYNNKAFHDMLEVYIKLYSYTTSDAIGGGYALASNHFFKEETAMIANGPWMMSALTDAEYCSEGFEKKVGFASFPENVSISSPESSAWVVSTDHEKSIQNGAVEFIKFHSRPENVIAGFKEMGGFSPNIKLSVEEYESLIPPMQDYSRLFENMGTIIPSYQTQWNSTIQNEVFTNDLPDLIKGNITIDDFIEIVNKNTIQYKYEIK